MGKISKSEQIFCVKFSLNFYRLLYKTNPQLCNSLQAGVPKNVSRKDCELIVLLASMFPAG